MSEFTPPGSGARMTKSQIKKYVQDMKNAQRVAEAKLEEARESGEFEKEEQELAQIEKNLEDYFS